MSLVFIVPGKPVAQGRPRGTLINGHIHMYEPKESKDYKKRVAFYVTSAVKKCQWQYTERPVKVGLIIYLPILAGTSKKLAELQEKGVDLPTKKPDVDNVFKSVTDALSGLIYKDDNQIVAASIEKYYSHVPRVEVEIEVIS